MRRLVIQGLLIAALVVLVGVGFLAWLGTDSGLVPVPPISPGAREIRDLYVFVGIFATLIFLAVTIPLALFIVKFRRGSRTRTEEGPQISGATRLELAWTAGAFAIVVILTVVTLVKMPGIRSPEAAGAGEALEVKVEGRQFYFRFVYPNGAVSYDRIVLPVDRLVETHITAPESDVQHSFWVPALGPKMDAIPGVVNVVGYRPDRLGVYEGKCAELCGLQHAIMNFTAEVMEQQEFDRWVEEARPERNDDLGQEIFETVCTKCHFAAPEYAPNLAGNPLLADEEALAEIVRNGRGAMPPVGSTWTDAEVDALVEYAAQFAGGGDGS